MQFCCIIKEKNKFATKLHIYDYFKLLAARTLTLDGKLNRFRKEFRGKNVA
jgi:hypothetical protein